MVERLSELTGHMTVQPAGTSFEGCVTVVKNLANAFFKQQTIGTGAVGEIYFG